MSERFGIILLDDHELLLRIYQISIPGRFTLTQYFNKIYSYNFPLLHPRDDITLILAELFTKEFTQHIAEWKLCTRNITPKVAEELNHLTGLNPELLTPSREQELLCKGILTELW